jgi:C4-dicarboxylate-specific signal transduction histidine kinase
VAQPLGRQILLLQAILLPLLLGLVVWAFRATYRDQVSQLEEESRVTAVTVVAYINRNLAAADAVAEALRLHPEVRAASPNALADLAKLGFRNAVLARADGRVVGWARPIDPDIEGMLPSSWLAEVARGGRNAVSSLLGGAGSEHVLVLGYPVRGDSGAVSAVLGLEVHLEGVEKVLASIPLPEGSVVTISDRNGIVVARSRDAERFVGRPVEEPALILPLDQVPAIVFTRGLDGMQRVFRNLVVDRGPWLVSVGIPTRVAWERSLPTYRRNAAVVIAVALIVLALELLLVRRLVGAFQHLEHAAERVGEGDLTPPAPHPMPARELERLQDVFAKMVLDLRSAQAAVQNQVAEERRMREELQLLQRQVIRQERLAAIGVLVSGVAHELNNPLQAILGFSELLQLADGIPDHVRADLSLIQKESARASAIIRNLSRFGRQQTSEPTLVRLDEVVASVVELRQRKAEEANIQLSVHLASRAMVTAIFTELQQVLLNFVINAEQALNGSSAWPRRITIRTAHEDGRVRLDVEDTGPGVPPNDESRLFQPFFTTKPVGEGTGLGLSVSYGIIQSHGGTIGYRRSPTGGAIFYFELPIAENGARIDGAA